MSNATDDLHRLAEWHGLQQTFFDVFGNHHSASTDSLLSALQCLGVPIERPDQASSLLCAAQQHRARSAIEPVIVVWDARSDAIEMRFPARALPKSVSCRVIVERGETQNWQALVDQLETTHSFEVHGESYHAMRLPLPASLPLGYHRLELKTEHQQFFSLLVVAPSLAFAPAGEKAKTWGVFAPLYALHSQNSWGAGDLSDLAALNAWVSQRGGGLVATLPLLASFFGSLEDSSPYRPASRLFWNEFYLDLTRIPELNDCPAARQLLESVEIRAEIDQLRSTPLVDYDRQMSAKRRVLQCLAQHFFASPSARREGFEQFLREHSAAESYAKFRAVGERHGRTWRNWPVALRDGRITSSDYDDVAFQYHAFAQWQVHEQLSWMSKQAASMGLTWYLDMPLGVHPDGFDTWRERDVFAMNASAGAPPDAFFTAGQCWQFPPFHPGRLRETGYQHLRSVLEAHLRFARLLRIDHVMGLHRLYWIPDGMEAKDGLYVRYPADELYAVLALESQRHQARIIGENLGTVPPEVDQAMDMHGVGRLFVVQFEANENPDFAIPEVPANTVASLNTHDTPPFAAFWEGLDIDDRLDLGLIDDAELHAQKQQRESLRAALIQFLREKGFLDASQVDAQAVLAACLTYLGKSASEVVLVNLEDLWLETGSQNTPGTSVERVNWRQRAKYSIDQLGELRAEQILRLVDESRGHR